MRILLAGATGLVGQGVLHECLRAADVTHITALGRHPSGQSDPKLAVSMLHDLFVPDFADLGAAEDRLRQFDACLYCDGAPPIGSLEAEYRHVNLVLTMHVAQTVARLNPRITFIYISGAYANPDSHVMVLRIKGETERALAALPIRTVMLRPGGIQPVGDERSPHAALAMVYRIAGPLMGLGVRLAPQLLTTTERVGRAMLQLARDVDPPSVVENAEINRLGE